MVAIADKFGGSCYVNAEAVVLIQQFHEEKIDRGVKSVVLLSCGEFMKSTATPEELMSIICKEGATA